MMLADPSPQLPIMLRAAQYSFNGESLGITENWILQIKKKVWLNSLDTFTKMQ